MAEAATHKASDSIRKLQNVVGLGGVMSRLMARLR